jgi:hypothetical protein
MVIGAAHAEVHADPSSPPPSMWISFLAPRENEPAGLIFSITHSITSLAVIETWSVPSRIMAVVAATWR